MRKIGENFGVELDESQSKKIVIDEARTSGATFHFASLMDIWHLKTLNWRQNTKHIKVELYSEVILSKTILDVTQYSRKKDHQHHK